MFQRKQFLAMSHYFILEFTTNKGRFSLYMEFHMRQGADAVIFILLSYFITIVSGLHKFRQGS